MPLLDLTGSINPISSNSPNAKNAWWRFTEAWGRYTGMLKRDDLNTSSLNLHESQFKFDIDYGHDHGAAGIGGARIHNHAIRKESFNLNDLTVLWGSYFDIYAAEYGIQYLIAAGKVSIDVSHAVSGGEGYDGESSALVFDPTDGSCLLDLYTFVSGEVFRTDIAADNTSWAPVAFIPRGAQGVQDLKCCYLYINSNGERKIYVGKVTSDAAVKVDFICIMKASRY